MELQADCLAGVWGYHAQHGRNLIEPGDFEAGLRAAAAIGDDRLQKAGQGYVNEKLDKGSKVTHNMAPSRIQSGDPKVCDTFQGSRL